MGTQRKHHCPECGMPFMAHRSDAITCSDPCRARRSRRSRAIAKSTDGILAGMAVLASEVQQGSFRHKAWSELWWVVNYANAVYTAVSFGQRVPEWTSFQPPAGEELPAHYIGQPPID